MLADMSAGACKYAILTVNFRALPHIRGQSSYNPSGNPVYARDMLMFPTEAENCKLGSTNVYARVLIVGPVRQ